MIFGNPIRGTIYLSAGTVAGRARWWRTQRYGCTGFTWEPPLGGCNHFHRGIDISRGEAGCGDDLLATAAGTVIYAGFLTDGARAVVIRHDDGWATGHGHLASFTVSRGQHVSKGQRIGTVGRSGLATGCHDHYMVKRDFPAGAGVNEFFRDPGAGGRGALVDPWPLLAQNVTVHPRSSAGIRIRTGSSTGAGVFATVGADGHLHRAADGADLGSASTPRQWGGTVTGGSYTVDGKTSSKWEKMWLDGGWRYLATLLAVRSAS